MKQHKITSLKLLILVVVILSVGVIYLFSNLFEQPFMSGVIDKSGKKIFSENYVIARYQFHEGLIRIRPKGTVEFLNIDGKRPFKQVFKEAEDLREGLAAVSSMETKKWGFIDSHGKFAISPQFEDASSFSDGLAPAKLNGQWGFINKSGEWIVEPQFENVIPFSDGRAAVSAHKKIGFIDISGAFVIEPQYDEAASFSEGLARVVKYRSSSNDRIVQYIDTDGKKVINLNSVLSKLAGRNYSPGDHTMHLYRDTDEYLFAGNEQRNRHRKHELNRFGKNDFQLSDGLIQVSVDSKYGFIDKTGKVVIPLQFNTASAFSEGLAVVGIGELDTTMRLEISSQAKTGIRYGFINQAGEIAIPLRYKHARSFSNGLALCRSEQGNRVFVSPDGSTAFELSNRMGDVGDFREGLAAVGKPLSVKF